MKDDFKEKAKEWDTNPARVEIAKRFSDEVKKNIAIGKDMKLLEFGCGTGLVGLSFSSSVDSIIMVDNSPAMLSVLREKVAANRKGNIHILEGDIDALDIKESSLDLILSSMAFHHVKDIPAVLRIFKKILHENGTVIIGDLCTEDGSFHAPEIVAHNGFDMEEIRSIFDSNGLYVENIYVYNTISRPDKKYGQFILKARTNKR